MTIETEIAGLTQATTDLLAAVNVRKTVLDARVQDAADLAAQADANGAAQVALAVDQVALAAAEAASASASASAASASRADALAIYGNTTVMRTSVTTAAASANTAAAAAAAATNSSQQAAAAVTGISALATGSASLLPSTWPSLNLDFANSKVLDPRITFSRASAATYYDGKTVAKAEENLFTRSQEFSNSFWNKYDATVAGSSTTAPDGTLTASKLSEASTASVSKRIDCALPSLQSTNYTISIYAKSAELSYLRITETSTGTARTSWFNVAAGTLGTTSPSHSATIIAVGNGWFRCSIAFLASTVTPGPSFGISNADNVSVYAGNGSDGLHIWGAQLEQRSQVTAYTPTTTQPITNYIPVLQTALAGVPRFDHDPVAGASLGLLIEESRANLISNSNSFPWAETTTVPGTALLRLRQANAAVAPDGTVTATKLSTSPDLDNQRIYLPTTAGTGVFTYSVYAKAGEYSRIGLKWSAGAASYFIFDLSSGTVLQSGNSTSQTVSSVGNGWYRLSITATATVNPVVWISILANTGDSYTGDGYSGVYIWGAQLEAGSFPTSYIKTEASQVTRAADSASMTGANFSSWYRQDEGTLIGTTKRQAGNFSSRLAYLAKDLETQEFIGISVSSVSGTNAEIRRGGAQQLSMGVGVTSEGQFTSGLAYKTDDCAYSINGATPLTDSAVLLPATTANRLGIGTVGSYQGHGHIKRIAYYPKRLSDAQLQALTA